MLLRHARLPFRHSPALSMVLLDAYSTVIMRLRGHELRSGSHVSRPSRQQLLNGGFDVLGNVELLGCHSCRNTDRAFVTDGSGSPNPVITFFASTAARLPRRERLTWSVFLGSYSGMGSFQRCLWRSRDFLLIQLVVQNGFAATRQTRCC